MSIAQHARQLGTPQTFGPVLKMIGLSFQGQLGNQMFQYAAARIQAERLGCGMVIDYNCEFLKDGKCSIYEARPDICRRFTCIDAG